MRGFCREYGGQVLGLRVVDVVFEIDRDLDLREHAVSERGDRIANEEGTHPAGMVTATVPIAVNCMPALRVKLVKTSPRKKRSLPQSRK